MVGGKGTINLKGITLKNIIHVPDLKANLLSLAQLVIDTGWRFILDSDSCFLCVKATGRKISSVKKTCELLILDELEEHTPRQVVYSTQSDQRAILVHRRLGHPSFHILKSVYPTLFKGVNIETLTCEACQFAKHKRASFPQSTHRYLTPFKCIHSDVWGPCSTLGLLHHKWFILFVDDFTRYTWVYLLKSKTEIPSIITLFCEMVYNQFHKRIKIFRSDNAKEYFCREVNTYMEQNGIFFF